MFAIYDSQGRSFRNSLENLRKVREAPANAEAHLRSSGPEHGAQPILGATSRSTEDVTVSGKALQAYKGMLHLNNREPICHAYQLMSYPVRTVRAEMDILAARSYFQQQGFQQMPVTNAQQRLVGMLTIKDLLQFIVIDEDQVLCPGGNSVADAMSQETITADPVSDIRRVAQAMYEYRLRSVPIVDEQDALAGIISRSDILRAVTHDPPLSLWS